MLKKMLAAIFVLMLAGFACAGEAVIPFGEELRFHTQVTADGKARLNGEQDYETLCFTIRMTGSRGPEYFRRYYADSYLLKGDEAVAEFALTLHNGDGEISPGSAILFTLQSETGADVPGYRLTDREIGGSTDLTMNAGTSLAAFKRYDYDPTLCRLAVHTFNNGEEQVYLLALPDG